MKNQNRRDFLKTAGVLTTASCLPINLVELAFADQPKNFTFAYISDSHIQHIKGTKFVNNWDRGLIRAVAETNLLDPKPDFVVFGGDLAQLGTQAELDHGAEMLAKLNEIVAEMHADGTLTNLSMQYYGEDITKAQ